MPVLSAKWDFENLPDNPGKVAQKIRAFIKNNFPELEIAEFHAYAGHFPIKDKSQWTHGGITMVHVFPRPNAADFQIMEDVYKFIYDIHPPPYVLLITGDSDFVELLKSLKALGVFSILIYPGDRDPTRKMEALKEASSCRFSLRSVLDGTAVPVIRNMPPPVPPLPPIPNIIFWEIGAFPIPTNEDMPVQMQHQQITNFLRTKLHKKSDSKVYAYGKKQQIFDNEMGHVFGTRYIEICENELESRCVETMLITTIMSAAVELNVVGLKGEFMVITNNEEVSSLLHYLTGRGHRIITVTGSKPYERLLSTRADSFVWPKDVGQNLISSKRVSFNGSKENGRTWS